MQSGNHLEVRWFHFTTTRPLELDNHKLPEDTIAMINLVSYMQVCV